MLDGVEVADRACYLDAEGVLVVADLHLGFDASSAVTMPVGEGDAVRAHLEDLLDSFSPQSVVVAGDLLHAFDTLPRGVQDTLESIERTVDETGATLRVTRGNHDTMLDEIGFQGTASETVSAGETIIAHGHEEITEAASRYIIGHEHPTIEIAGKRYPCMLVGERVWNGRDVLVLPALSPLVRGTPVNEIRRGDALSPLLADPGSFRPVVVGAEEVHHFPTLTELRPYL